jgi:threonine aldolase
VVLKYSLKCDDDGKCSKARIIPDFQARLRHVYRQFRQEDLVARRTEGLFEHNAYFAKNSYKPVCARLNQRKNLNKFTPIMH